MVHPRSPVRDGGGGRRSNRIVSSPGSIGWAAKRREQRLVVERALFVSKGLSPAGGPRIVFSRAVGLNRMPRTDEIPLVVADSV